MCIKINVIMSKPKIKKSFNFLSYCYNETLLLSYLLYKEHWIKCFKIVSCTKCSLIKDKFLISTKTL